jgi:hypothetical protein
MVMNVKIHVESIGWIYRHKIRSSGRLWECSIVSLGFVKVGNSLSSSQDGPCCVE